MLDLCFQLTSDVFNLKPLDPSLLQVLITPPHLKSSPPNTPAPLTSIAATYVVVTDITKAEVDQVVDPFVEVEVILVAVIEVEDNNKHNMFSLLMGGPLFRLGQLINISLLLGPMSIWPTFSRLVIQPNSLIINNIGLILVHNKVSRLLSLLLHQISPLPSDRCSKQ